VHDHVLVLSVGTPVPVGRGQAGVVIGSKWYSYSILTQILIDKCKSCDHQL